jgi:hypothetical protein
MAMEPETGMNRFPNPWRLRKSCAIAAFPASCSGAISPGDDVLHGRSIPRPCLITGRGQPPFCERAFDILLILPYCLFSNRQNCRIEKSPRNMQKMMAGIRLSQYADDENHSTIFSVQFCLPFIPQ